MKVEIDEDERWPDYSIYEYKSDPVFTHFKVVEVPEKLFKQYQAIQTAYAEMQIKLEALYKSSSKI